MAYLLEKDDDTDAILSRGILMPTLQHKWRVVFDDTTNIKIPDNAQYKILMMQATRCELDYVNKTMTLEIEQSTVGDEHVDIIDLVKRYNLTVRVDSLDGNEGLHHSVVSYHSKPIAHKVVYDYAESGVVKHIITIKIGNIVIMAEQKQNPIETKTPA